MTTVEIEQVLVVPTDLFRSLGYFQGFSREAEVYIDRLLTSDLVEYRPRDEMEEDPSFKQLIPYCVFSHTDSAGVQRVFRYTRKSRQGEARLNAKMSIGVGGHISLQDSVVQGRAVYQLGLRRELDEEVRIETPFSERCVGLINDDETEVGRVHLGIVHQFEVEQPLVFPRETGIADAGFLTLDEIAADFDRLESWSQICLRALFEPTN